MIIFLDRYSKKFLWVNSDKFRNLLIVWKTDSFFFLGFFLMRFVFVLDFLVFCRDFLDLSFFSLICLGFIGFIRDLVI